MSKFTEVPLDKVKKDKKKFLSKYGEPPRKNFVYTVDAINSIVKKLYFLINTQNGSNGDDTEVLENPPVYRYLKDDIVGKTALFMGTGSGREMVTARELGADRVEGTTVGEWNVLFAKEILGVEPVPCDTHVVPWSANTFDIVAAFQILEHSPMPIVFLLECNRVLKTGGLLCIETPPAKTHSYGSWLHHIICPTPRQLYCLCLKAGFKPITFISDNGIYNLQEEEIDAIPEIDSSDTMVCIKAIKQDPVTYERGDIKRYYDILNGQGFK